MQYLNDAVGFLVHTESFPQRWYCGLWPEWLGWSHIVSDIFIGGVYIFLAYFVVYVGKKNGVIFLPLWSGMWFFLSCGSDHLIDALIFWHPVYVLQGLMKILQVISLCIFVPSFLLLELPRWWGPTKVQNIEAELRKKDLYWQSYANSASIAFYFCNTEGICTFANKPLYTLAGKPSRSLEGKDASKILFNKNRQALAGIELLSTESGSKVKCVIKLIPSYMGTDHIGTRVEVLPMADKTLLDYADDLRSHASRRTRK